MTKNECRNWLINIENSAAAVESRLGSAVVKSVFERYGAHSIKNLNPCYFPDIFSELYAIEVDSTKANRPEHDIKLLAAKYRITRSLMAQRYPAEQVNNVAAF